jgi:hypothetical protein
MQRLQRRVARRPDEALEHASLRSRSDLDPNLASEVRLP